MLSCQKIPIHLCPEWENLNKSSTKQHISLTLGLTIYSYKAIS